MSHRTLIGKPAPAITLNNHDGESFTLTPGGKGLPTVVFFYPKAGSYGCTKEACQFRDAVSEKDLYKPEKVELVGVSPDPVEKQKAFVAKNKLTYPVLSDPKGEAAKAYGVGKGLFGFADVARVTFVIDDKGNIRDTLEGTLNYGAHSKFVTKWLDKLKAESEKEQAPAETAAATVEVPAVPAVDTLAAPAA
ncbi:thioredoxin-like protein [Favolaschia claudopus]|uniref:thioredoxin-dependent peroxiredoxin n=1 Tax=Favolaschia claudopus TaxID=2862362 RepID=A0AAW0D6T8_9AGAR